MKPETAPSFLGVASGLRGRGELTAQIQKSIDISESYFVGLPRNYVVLIGTIESVDALESSWIEQSALVERNLVARSP